MWADMIIKNIDQFDEQDIEYLLHHDKFVAKQHAGTGKLSSYSEIQPANANRIKPMLLLRIIKKKTT